MGKEIEYTTVGVMKQTREILDQMIIKEFDASGRKITFSEAFNRLVLEKSERFGSLKFPKFRNRRSNVIIKNPDIIRMEKFGLTKEQNDLYNTWVSLIGTDYEAKMMSGPKGEEIKIILYILGVKNEK